MYNGALFHKRTRNCLQNGPFFLQQNKFLPNQNVFLICISFLKIIKSKRPIHKIITSIIFIGLICNYDYATMDIGNSLMILSQLNRQGPEQMSILTDFRGFFNFLFFLHPHNIYFDQLRSFKSRIVHFTLRGQSKRISGHIYQLENQFFIKDA